MTIWTNGHAGYCPGLAPAALPLAHLAFALWFYLGKHSVLPQKNVCLGVAALLLA